MHNSVSEPAISVPVVDLNETPAQLSRSLAQAMQLSGFFYLANHGISDAVMAALMDQTRSFFGAPESVRNAIGINQHNRGYLAPGEAQMAGATRVDLKEVFFFGRELAPDDPDLAAGVALVAHNQWPDPDQVPGFRSAVQDYLTAATDAGRRLLTGIALLMDAPPDFFDAHYQRPMARGQLIHYPKPPADAPPDQFGVAEHTDFGCITLLYQHTPGLQVLSRQGWIDVAPRDGCLVVNIGDLLERWSNGRLPSTRHRVRNRTGDSRYAAAIFFDPSPTAMIDPRDLMPPSENATVNFEAIAAAEYILSRSAGVFAQFKK